MKTQLITYLRKGLLRLLPLLFLGSAAQANIVHYYSDLSGAAEATPNASPGTGWADLVYDDAAQTLLVQISFADLLAPTTASHIHAPTLAPDNGAAGVATQTPTFTGFPLGVTSGSYSHLFDLTQASTFNASYVTANGGVAGAAMALIAAMDADKAYLNVHSSRFPAGEIRGFLHNVPDATSSALLLMLGMGCVAGWARNRRLQAS